MTLGRVLTESEVENLQDKGRFLRRLAGQAEYARVFEGVVRWENTVKRLAQEFAAGSAGPDSRSSAISELRIMRRHLERFAAEMEREVNAEQAAAGSRRNGFDRALATLKETNGWALLEQIAGTPDAPSLRWAEERVEVAPNPNEGPWYPALDLIYDLAAHCQSLVGAYLEFYRQRFTDAAVAVRKVGAEVLTGTPCIVTIPLDHETGEESRSTMSFEDLPVEEIEAVAEALRRISYADRIASETHEANQAGPSEPSTEPPAGKSRPIDPHEPTSEDEGPDAEAADLGALATQVVEILPELEQAWSKALDDTDLESARAETQTSWQTLVLVVQRQLALGERRLQAADINSRLPGFPPSGDDLAAYDALPDDERHWRLMQMAEVWAIARLAQVMAALTEKTQQVVELPSGETKSWWESGAFGLVRAWALALARITRLARRAESRLLGDEVPASFRHDSDEILDAGMNAALRGDSEAAVIHCLAALRARVKHVVGSDELPEDYLARLGALPGAPEDGYVLGAAARLASTSLDEERDIGEFTVLAELLIPVTIWICDKTSDDAIRRVFEDGGDD